MLCIIGDGWSRLVLKTCFLQSITVMLCTDYNCSGSLLNARHYALITPALCLCWMLNIMHWLHLRCVSVECSTLCTDYNCSVSLLNAQHYALITPALCLCWILDIMHWLHLRCVSVAYSTLCTTAYSTLCTDYTCAVFLLNAQHYALITPALCLRCRSHIRIISIRLWRPASDLLAWCGQWE